MTKRAVITGVSKGIGEAIAKELLVMGFDVVGISRRPPLWEHKNLHFISCDLTDTKKLSLVCEEILQHGEIDLFIPNAGMGVFAPCEELPQKEIVAMTNLNLLAPMVMTKIFLRSLKKQEGKIIAISSITAHKTSPLGSVYAATKAGLTHFYANLFEEVRKSGVSISTIHPDMTDTPFYENLSFGVGENPESYITPECVAQGVRTILESRKGSVISSLTIRPQKVMIQKKQRG